MDVLRVEPTSEQGFGKAKPGWIVAGSGEPLAFDFFNRVAAGDEVTEQRADGGADDEIRFEVAGEDFPGA
jgi:hypothetical protein